ncbi:MAG: hypothetical protein IT299_02660 [Dehalococcoidia bacterium]|nr:hypothetical protein [Dehalococcoidia bacterium]
MSWRAPVSMVAAAALALLVHGMPEAGTFAAFTVSDAASGIVRAGSWAVPTPTSTPTPVPPTPTPSATPAPNPCLELPPEQQHLCHIVPSRGTSGSSLPPLPTPTARPLSSPTPTILGGFFVSPPAGTPAPR